MRAESAAVLRAAHVDLPPAELQPVEIFDGVGDSRLVGVLAKGETAARH